MHRDVHYKSRTYHEILQDVNYTEEMSHFHGSQMMQQYTCTINLLRTIFPLKKKRGEKKLKPTGFESHFMVCLFENILLTQ